MGKFLVHHYNGETGEYLNSGMDANENPKRPGEAMVPRNATMIEPPTAAEHQKAIWTKTGPQQDQGSWSLVPDYRGITYYKKDTQEEVKLELGQELDETNLTTIQPISHDYVWSATTSEWEMPLETARAQKISEIKYARWRAVEDGSITYSGLTFPTDEAARNALIFARDAYKDTGHLTEAWQARDGVLPITNISQITDIGTAVGLFMEDQFQKQFTLVTQAKAATTLEELAAIKWENDMAAPATA